MSRNNVTASSPSPKLSPKKIKPILSWAGSKFSQHRIIDLLEANLKASNRSVLVLPFAGALGDYFALLKRGINIDKVYASDSSQEVIGFYKWIQNGGVFNWDILSIFNWKEKYYELREKFNSEMGLRWENNPKMSDNDFYTLFYRINKTCVNGLWRVSKKGYFNVPIGGIKGKNKQIKTVPNLDYYRELFKNVIFSCTPFQYIDIPHNSFIYCDPPYHNTFDSYTKENFPTFELYEVGNNWVFNNCYVAISNSHYTKKWFDQFRFKTIFLEEQRSISCDGDRSKACTLFGIKNPN